MSYKVQVLIVPTGNLEEDIQHLFKFYEKVRAKNPENKGKLHRES